MPPALTLSALTLYPVKSCAGIPLQRAVLDRRGLAGDRRWMLVDASGRFITQRDQPELALIRTQWDGAALTLSAGGERCRVAVPGAGARRCQVTVWNDCVDACDAGEYPARWLRRHTGLACRLVYMPESTRRAVDARYARNGDTVGFADGFPLLLISQASLDDLNARLPAPVPMDRFRPNLVVSGCTPFAEDGWRRLRIGGVELDVVKPCSRCAIPGIDQATARRDPHILRVLAGFRRRDGTVYFGQNLLHDGPGRLQLGDEVVVLDQLAANTVDRRSGGRDR